MGSGADSRWQVCELCGESSLLGEEHLCPFEIHEIHYSTNIDSALDKQEGGSHYKDMAIQPIEFIMANKLGFLEGNVLKYISRHRTKNGAQDIEKAIHYCELLLEFEYGRTR